MMTEPRDHGGGLDAAIAHYGGAREDWVDLSTGINPCPYSLGDIPARAWAALPDRAATDRLIAAARAFWQVPNGAEIVIAPGASALIARLPALAAIGTVRIPGPTYNEHAAAFAAAGWSITEDMDAPADAQVLVHPNNPDGRLWDALPLATLTIIDESFADVTPKASHVARASDPGVIVLKSFGKFWGLAGLRLGFAICAADHAARLRALLGPWPVAGPALEIGARALENTEWAAQTRARLTRDAARLDAVMSASGATCLGGTTLFRLYDTDDAPAWQNRLAKARIWSRIFPYSRNWLRLGLPASGQWEQLDAALR